MKSYKITTQEMGGFPLEEYGDPETTIVEAENEIDLMDKMEWKLDEDDENHKYSNELVLECIKSEDMFFYRDDTDSYDSELYVWDGENSDGTKIEIEIV